MLLKVFVFSKNVDFSPVNVCFVCLQTVSISESVEYLEWSFDVGPWMLDIQDYLLRNGITISSSKMRKCHYVFPIQKTNYVVLHNTQHSGLSKVQKLLDEISFSPNGKSNREEIGNSAENRVVKFKLYMLLFWISHSNSRKWKGSNFQEKKNIFVVLYPLFL